MTDSDYKQQAADISGDAKAVEGLLKEIHELKRTRSEAEADARKDGFRQGAEFVIGQLRAQKIVVEIVEPKHDHIINWLRRNANAETKPESRAAFIEAHNAAKAIAEGRD